jgi:hemerythrin superfamily protein
MHDYFPRFYFALLITHQVTSERQIFPDVAFIGGNKENHSIADMSDFT